MSGTENKNSKKGELLKQFRLLEIPEDKLSEFQNKIMLKGRQRYHELYKALLKENNGEKISWEVLSHHYRYDIKLRRVLYKIISFTEVAMRATIANNYQIDNMTQYTYESELKKTINNKINFTNKEKNKIGVVFNDKSEVSLFEFLENIDMQILNKIFIHIKKSMIMDLFSDNEKLSQNLDAMRKLRNSVMHNKILITKEYGRVWIGGVEKTDLQSHIENAIMLSPYLAKDNLKKAVNECLIIDEKQELHSTKDKNIEENRYKLFNKYKVYFEEVL